MRFESILLICKMASSNTFFMCLDGFLALYICLQAKTNIFIEFPPR